MQNDCLTLQEYEAIAVRYLGKNLPSARKNPDHINRLIYYMLKADVSYDGNTGSLKGRRMSYAKFATQHIKASLKSRKKNTTYSLDTVVGGNKSRESTSGESITYNELTPIEQVEFNELIEYINSDQLSGLESCAIREYYLEHSSIKDIALKFNVTRQSIYLAISRGLDKIKEIYGKEESY